MLSVNILHALGLHLYQPAGNLHRLLRDNEGELRRILLSYERLVRHAHKYADVARLHVAVSPVLLEQLRDPDLIEACRDLADIPSILESLRSAVSIEFIGTGFRHAPLPLIPRPDWDEQLRNERATLEATLGRVPKGYWPPEDECIPEMIPALVKVGYEYLLLSASALVAPDGGNVDPYRVYKLCHEGACITVVPLDPGFSQSQQYGLEAPWFADAVRDGVAQAPASEVPYLLSTWSDGENGEWFRRLDEEYGYFGQFFSPYMEFCENGEFPVRPIFLSDYLSYVRPQVEVELREAAPLALDTAMHDKLFSVSASYWSLARGDTGQAVPSLKELLQARDMLLCAEESALLLGDAVQQQELLDLLSRAERILTPKQTARIRTEEPKLVAQAVAPAPIAKNKAEAPKPAPEAVAPAPIVKVRAEERKPAAETAAPVPTAKIGAEESKPAAEAVALVPTAGSLKDIEPELEKEAPPKAYRPKSQGPVSPAKPTKARRPAAVSKGVTRSARTKKSRKK